MGQTITIPAVDQNGRLYPIEKLEAHRLGVLHIAISIFVFSRGQLLIQKRAPTKYHSGGLWANTCCTHPGWNEDLETAAHRRLREELGLDVPVLEPRGEIQYKARVSNDLWEHERVTLFRYATNGPPPAPKPAANEVSETRWISIPDLRHEAQTSPEQFAPWFLIYVGHWNELGLSADTAL